jgi:hypothetical protein
MQLVYLLAYHVKEFFRLYKKKFFIVTTKDKNRVELSYNWNFGNEGKRPTVFDTTATAYQLTKLTTQKYDLVERENRIAKQKKFSATAGGF